MAHALDFTLYAYSPRPNIHIMTVTVLLFASYADALGSDRSSSRCRRDATVADVVAQCAPCPARRSCRRAARGGERAYARARSARRRGRRSRDHSAGGGRLTCGPRSFDRAIDAAALMAEVADAANGATIAVSRHGARRERRARASPASSTARIGAMAERELDDDRERGASAFGTTHLVVEHRLGALELGEASVAIVVAHPHRGAAYDASRYVIEEAQAARADLEARAIRGRDDASG